MPLCWGPAAHSEQAVPEETAVALLRGLKGSGECLQEVRAIYSMLMAHDLEVDWQWLRRSHQIPEPLQTEVFEYKLPLQKHPTCSIGGVNARGMSHARLSRPASAANDLDESALHASPLEPLPQLTWVPLLGSN